MTQEDSSVPVVLVATSLSRTSGGGWTFLEGLVRSLATQSTRIKLTVIAPRNHLETVGSWAPQAQTLGVLPLVGVWRVMRDFAVAWWWTMRVGARVLIQPHEWAPPTPGECIAISQNIGPFHPVSAANAGLGGRLIKWLSIRTSGWMSVMVAVSPIAERVMVQHLRNLARIEVIPEAVVSPVHGGQVVSPPPLAPEYDFCLVAGRATYKNSGLLERALARANIDRDRSRIVVVGGSLEVSASIEQRGHVDRNELLEIFARSRVVVIPSLVESFGLPAFEALSMGAVPVVLSRTAMEQWLGEIAVALAPDAAEHALSAMFAMASDELEDWVNHRNGGEVNIDELLSQFSPVHVGAAYASLIQSIAR